MHWTHVSSSQGYMFVFSFLFLTSCAVSCFLFKCLCVSAVSHSQGSDGLGLSSSSILLELLQRAVVEGKKAESYLHHLRKFKFFSPKIFYYLFSSTGGGNPDNNTDERKLDLNYFWSVPDKMFSFFMVCIFLYLCFFFTCHLLLIVDL